jgi:hypothetical protein
MDALAPRGQGRGAELLLAHCAALESPDDARPSPLERLEAALGGDLARTLLRELAAEPAGRPLPLA